MLTSLRTIQAMPSKKQIEREKKREYIRFRRGDCRRNSWAYPRERSLWCADHACAHCGSSKLWCDCGSTLRKVWIRTCSTTTPEAINAAKRREPLPNPAMLRKYDVHYGHVLIDPSELKNTKLEADLRAAGFIRRKRHWSSRALKRWQRKLARRAAYFATEAGRQQTICVLAEALLSR